MPLAPSTTAGTAAQRCGCAVNRVESRGQERPSRSAKPHRTAPVSALSVAGTTGAATRATAARNPTTTDPGTTNAIGAPRWDAKPCGAVAGAVLGVGAMVWLSRVWVVMSGSCGCGGEAWTGRPRRLLSGS